MSNRESNLNSYEPPEEDSPRPAETDDKDMTLGEKAVVFAIGLSIEFGFIVLIVVLYLVGGYWALFAVFVGIPLAGQRHFVTS